MSHWPCHEKAFGRLCLDPACSQAYSGTLANSLERMLWLLGTPDFLKPPVCSDAVRPKARHDSSNVGPKPPTKIEVGNSIDVIHYC